jgi:hypothetical protein
MHKNSNRSSRIHALILTKNQQRGIEKYQEVVANLDLTKHFLETFDKQKLQTFFKTEVDVATIMKYSNFI